MICPECGGKFVDGVERCADCEVALVAQDLESEPDRDEPEPLGPGDPSVVVLRTEDLAYAGLAAAALEEAGIPHYRREDSYRGLTPFIPAKPLAGPGPWWVIYVPEAVAEEARSILERLPAAVEGSPEVSDFGPAERSRVTFKLWVLALLVLLALAAAWSLWDLLQQLDG